MLQIQAALAMAAIATGQLALDPGSIAGVERYTYVRMALSPDVVVMAWLSAPPFENGQIFASYSVEGTKWSQPVQVSGGYPDWVFAGGAGELALARASNGTYWLAWSAGTAWLAAVTPARGSADSGQSYLARGSTVWLASSPDGRAWSKPQPVALAPAFNRAPSIIEMPDGRVGVIWVSDRHDRPALWLTFMGGDGTWSPPTEIGFVRSIESTPLPSNSYQYDLAHSGPLFVPDSKGRLILAWVRDEDGGPQVWTALSADGRDWSPPVRVSSGPGDKGLLTIEETDGAYDLYWTAAQGQNEQRWVSHSPDFVAWSEPEPAPLGK